MAVDLTKWNLSDALAEVLEQCLDRGMQPPLIMVAVSPNGSVSVTRWPEGHDPEPLAEYFEPAGFALPMTLVVVDQRNEAVRVVFTAAGTAVWH
jgi:hypothetical protein